MNKILRFVLLTSVVAITSCSSEIFINTGKKWNTKEVLQQINDNTVFFLDYKKLRSRNDIASLDYMDIAKVSAYSQSDKDVPAVFRKDLKNGVVSFITKKYAISQYQPKLGELSKEYKDLIITKSSNRDNLYYVVRDSALKPSVEGKLIDLNFSKIKSIKVLTPSDAQAIYGTNAADGAVIID